MASLFWKIVTKQLLTMRKELIWTHPITARGAVIDVAASLKDDVGVRKDRGGGSEMPITTSTPLPGYSGHPGHPGHPTIVSKSKWMEIQFGTVLGICTPSLDSPRFEHRAACEDVAWRLVRTR